MSELLLILIGTVLVNNLVLTRFLGLCPFLGVSGKLETAIGMSARNLQFVPDVTRLPVWWGHPVGRIMFQFKNFAFNQTKFIRDQVFN